MKERQNATSGGVSDYTNLVNQNGFLDGLADPLMAQGNSAPRNQGDRETNALLAGFGGGLKGVANQQRTDKLAEIREMSRQIAMLDSSYKIQMGEIEATKAETANFTMKYQRELMSLAKAQEAGDQVAVNKIAGKIFNAAAQSIGGFKDTYGDFSHAYDGYVYYEKDGEVGGVSLKEMVGELPVNEVFGARAEELGPLLNATYQKQFQETNFLKEQAMQEAELKNRELSSKIGVNNAHAGLYNTQAQNEMTQMQNPAKYSKEVTKEIMQSNIQWGNSLGKEHQQLERESRAYDKIAQLIEDDLRSGGTAGSSLIAKAKQIIASRTGEDRNRQLSEMYKQPILAGIKQIFSGSTSDKDIVTFLAGVPDFSKDPTASIMVAKERAAEIKNRLKKENLTRKVVERDFGWQEPYNSLAVQDRVSELMQQEQPNSVMQNTSQSANSNSNDLSDLE